MAERRELACVIAAGGTAGHVLPALAVAEALQARGVRVSFAGSPDRVEARLVPDAGYEFDPFDSAGLPRRPGIALADPRLRAAGFRPPQSVAVLAAGSAVEELVDRCKAVRPAQAGLFAAPRTARGRAG